MYFHKNYLLIVNNCCNFAKSCADTSFAEAHRGEYTSGAEVDSENICKIRRKYLFKLI